MSVPADMRAGRHRFVLPPELEASEPPEARGLARDGVRLLVADGDDVRHRHFRELGEVLVPGDLLVVNTSATLAASVDGVRRDGRRVGVHFATRLDDGRWVVELRRLDNAGPERDARAGERLVLPGGVGLALESSYPVPGALGPRLWTARVALEGPVEAYLSLHGRPISYRYVPGRWPLRDYQTVFARPPGSAEMPSAGRPFTRPLVTSLVSRGVSLAPIVLHTGVSSPEAHEPPLPERFAVPEATARLVNATRSAGGRIIAVGTTATRALETVAGPDGIVRAGSGWTDLVLGPDRPVRAVDGIITGWHAPEASHLDLLDAVAGAHVVDVAYTEALDNRYLWHEFGDSALLLRPA